MSGNATLNIVKYPSRGEVLSLLGRRRRVFEEVRHAVETVIEEIRAHGDRALEEFVARFEKFPVPIGKLRVSAEEFSAAQLDEEFESLIERFVERVKIFHSMQLENSRWMLTASGSVLGYLSIPLSSVGVYVPSGRAVYLSTLIMCVVPAQLAGVERIAIATPPDERGSVPALLLAVAKKLGIREVYKMGGAHAVAALALGTESVERVDKIVGPGNKYVAMAKKMLVDECGIDSVAGPSELLVIADESAPPKYVAADILSQAEHDEDALVALVTDSQELVDLTSRELAIMLKSLPEPNRARAAACLERNGFAFLVEDLRTAVELSNHVAPEHLEIVTREPFELLSSVRNAGSVFLGPLSSEPIGDYGIGPNHVLPTFSTARFSSGLGVWDFVKRVFVTHVSEAEIRRFGLDYAKLAKVEGLEAHALAVEARLEEIAKRWR